MARPSKSAEVGSILGPLAMDFLAALTEMGVVLTMEQTIALMQRIQRKAKELAPDDGNGRE